MAVAYHVVAAPLCCNFQVVGSRCWPLISRYRASVRTQSAKVEMIDALYKPLEDGSDDGIIRYITLVVDLCKKNYKKLLTSRSIPKYFLFLLITHLNIFHNTNSFI